MKNKTIALIWATLSAVLCGSVIINAEPASDVSFAVSIGGTANAADREGAVWLITKRNAEIVQENASRAAANPPQPPLPLLLFGTADEIKTSYQALLEELLLKIHASYVSQSGIDAANKDQVANLWRNATEAARAAAKAELVSGQKPQK
jgi:hypothetical protein